MAKVARVFNARFVVNVSELGEDDPLIQNATQLVPSMNVSWYATRASKVHDGDIFFLKKINISYGETLDIIGVNTGLLLDLTDTLTSTLNRTKKELSSLTRTLESTSGNNWRVVVGFDPLFACEGRNDELEANRVSKTLLHKFTKLEVNAYISAQDCSNQGIISSVENPGTNVKRPCLSFSNGRPEFRRELVDGFLLHRVSSLDLVTCFVTPAGEVVHRIALQKRGRNAM